MNGDGIRAEGVTVTYRNGHTALRDASFEVPRGTITALVGVNGAGKSTLFKALMNFVPVSAGRITILGQPVRAIMKQQAVAYVPQAEEVDWTFPVLVEDVGMMGRYGHMGFLRRPRAADHEAVAKALARVNMSEFRNRQIGELSGGQRQQVAFGRALMTKPKILMLDEPTAGVSPIVMDELFDRILEVARSGIPILMVEQNARQALEIADRGYVLVQGRNAFTGSGQELLADPEVRKSFLGG